MANDIYSLGATTFEMLTGDTPFGDDGGLVQKKGAEIPDLKGDYSEQLRKVIAKCLKTNPWERPTAEQLEKYAETALSGGRIQFFDEKTFFQKYKYYLYASLFVIIVGCFSIGYWINDNREKEKEFALQAKIIHVNDSILKRISASEELIHQQLAIGEQHEEGYELAYIKAYDELLVAISSANKLTNGIGKEKVGMLDNIKDSIEYKLCQAYSNFIEKSKLFEIDDPEVSDEFRKRATNISKRINVDKHNVATSADSHYNGESNIDSIN
jgi:serine/threonine protein kinase